MPASISWAIQAHPARTDLAHELAKAIGGDVEIAWDPDPDSLVKSPWRSFRNLLETTPADATHRFQIQEDGLVCRSFRTAVERAVEARPDHLLVFFVGRNANAHSDAVMYACERDEPWAELSYAHWCPVVATCWPVGLIQPLMEFVDAQNWSEKFNGDDEIVGRYLREIKHQPLASVPSLVEHPDVVPSLKSRRKNSVRVATCFIGQDCGDCALEIDWALGPGSAC